MRRTQTLVILPMLVLAGAQARAACPTEPTVPCWTVSGPAKFCTSAVTGAVSYRVYLAGTNTLLSTGTDPAVLAVPCPSTMLPLGTPFKVEVSGVDSAGREGPRSVPSAAPVYCSAPCGIDLDASGAVNSGDFSKGFLPAFQQGCVPRQ